MKRPFLARPSALNSSMPIASSHASTASTLQFRRNGELLRRPIPPHGQYIGLAAHLTGLHILLLRACRLVHRGLHPLPAPCALKPCCIHRPSSFPGSSE